MTFRSSSLCCAAVNTSMILIIAEATIFTPSSRSPSTLLLTLASSSVNTIARTMLATGFTAVCAIDNDRLYIDELYAAGVLSRSSTWLCEMPLLIALRMSTMKSTTARPYSAMVLNRAAAAMIRPPPTTCHTPD